MNFQFSVFNFQFVIPSVVEGSLPKVLSWHSEVLRQAQHDKFLYVVRDLSRELKSLVPDQERSDDD